MTGRPSSRPRKMTADDARAMLLGRPVTPQELPGEVTLEDIKTEFRQWAKCVRCLQRTFALCTLSGPLCFADGAPDLEGYQARVRALKYRCGHRTVLVCGSCNRVLKGLPPLHDWETPLEWGQAWSDDKKTPNQGERLKMEGF